jgi:hypothetical protein
LEVKRFLFTAEGRCFGKKEVFVNQRPLFGRFLLRLFRRQSFCFSAPGRSFPHIISAAIVSHKISVSCI